MSPNSPNRCHQRPLTFNPAVDDRDKLVTFLKTVVNKYIAKTSKGNDNSSEPKRLLISPPEAESEGEVGTARRNTGATHRARQGEAGSGLQVTKTSRQADADEGKSSSKTPSIGDSEGGKAGTKPRPEPTKNSRGANKGRKKGGRNKQSCVPSKLSQEAINRINRQLYAINRASLLRTSTMDINAPDPEQEAPPNETAAAKKRRIERINGRRKRARKLIEIDSVHGEFQTLLNRNKELVAENQAFRDKIAEVKRAQETGQEVVNLEGILGDRKPAAVDTQPLHEPESAAVDTADRKTEDNAEVFGSTVASPPVDQTHQSSRQQPYGSNINEHDLRQLQQSLSDFLLAQQSQQAGLGKSTGPGWQRQPQSPLQQGSMQRQLPFQQNITFKQQHPHGVGPSSQKHQVGFRQSQLPQQGSAMLGTLGATEWQIVSSILPALSQTAARTTGQAPEQVMAEAISILQGQRQLVFASGNPQKQQSPQYQLPVQGNFLQQEQQPPPHFGNQAAAAPNSVVKDSTNGNPSDDNAKAQVAARPPASPPPSNVHELKLWMEKHRERLRKEKEDHER